MSHREFIGWQAWLAEENNNPSRTDYYLMQIAYYVIQVFGKKGTLKLDNLRLKFGAKDTKDDDWKASRAQWVAMAQGVRPKTRPSK